MAETAARERFEEWVVLELMGHRKLGGKLTEQEIGGAAFLRIDVPGMTADDGFVATQYYTASAVYCITPVAEAVARAVAARHQPEPVTRWELPALPAPPHVRAREGAEEDDDVDLDDDDGVPV